MKKVLLTGANGVVGYPLMLRLDRKQFDYKIVSRKQSGQNLRWDLENKLSTDVRQKLSVFSPNVLLHCAPIWLLPEHLALFKKIGIQRIVAFSSSSISSKKYSNHGSEHKLVESLKSSEQTTRQFCAEHGISLTIFRPTMIYGNRRDKNICHIANFVSKFGFFLIAGKGDGLRQPVHADDLADASLSVIDNKRTFDKTYYLAGAETLTYTDMVGRIFLGLSRKQRIFSLPVNLFRLALRLGAIVGRFDYTSEMANRMNQDLNYDFSEAQRDFDYSPQAFMQKPLRDLPMSEK